MTAVSVSSAAWNGLVGQSHVRERLEEAALHPVHAYLFLGQTGNGLLEAAYGFAGLILANTVASEEAKDRAVRLAVSCKHPDVVLVESEGSALRVSEAEEVIRCAVRSPFESTKKVIIVSGIDSIETNAIGKLLKIVEEPPASAVFILLGQEVIPEIVTIASRCVPIDFAPYTTKEIESFLLAEGVSPERSEAVSVAAAGDLSRARLLATDEALAERAALWKSVPSVLDGQGSTVYSLVQQIQAGIESALDPLVDRQKRELKELDEQVKKTGERGSGRSTLVARHKREARRCRVDELLFGFATLSRHYRNMMISEHEAAAVSAVNSLQNASESLRRNPNERLLLQQLFIKLGG